MDRVEDAKDVGFPNGTLRRQVLCSTEVYTLQALCWPASLSFHWTLTPLQEKISVAFPEPTKKKMPSVCGRRESRGRALTVHESKACKWSRGVCPMA